MHNNDNLIRIDPRSHLEVADRHHRYAKNLRLYFKEYTRLFGCNAFVTISSEGYDRFQSFFQWLDDTSTTKPELSACPRVVLDNDRVLYLRTEQERAPFLVVIDENGLFRRQQSGELVTTSAKGWIFVIRDQRIFACEKRTAAYPRFHHSSFFAGDPVEAAGVLIAEQGRLLKLFPHSGHYRPEDRHFAWLLLYLQHYTLRLRDIKVDAQRVFKVSRQVDKDGPKTAKAETAYFVDGYTVLNYLRWSLHRHASSRGSSRSRAMTV
jgi:hypothetical protein